MATTLAAFAVPSAELKALNHMVSTLPAGSKLREALETLSSGISGGIDVTIANANEELTTSKAAALLGVSRAHLYKILDAGLIPFRIVGSSLRRMKASDVHRYLQETTHFRKADAEAIAQRKQLEDSIF